MTKSSRIGWGAFAWSALSAVAWAHREARPAGQPLGRGTRTRAGPGPIAGRLGARSQRHAAGFGQAVPQTMAGSIASNSLANQHRIYLCERPTHQVCSAHWLFMYMITLLIMMLGNGT